MKYAYLLKPHANSRYQAGVMPLAVAELCLMLKRFGRNVTPAVQQRAGMDLITFECETLDETAIRAISNCAHLYLLAAQHDGGLLEMLTSPAKAYLNDDLPAILKYKGKTNETFTHFLINMAHCSSAFFDNKESLYLLDPMCGRGTALFEALNRGWNAAGVDIQGTDVEEAGKFFKKYLEYHRMKHTVTQKSMTARGKEAAVIKNYEFARDTASFKQGDTRTLSLAALDGGRIAALWPKPAFHLLTADLPYGVQHAPGGVKMPSLQQMLINVLPAWRDALLPGGAMALAFNINTLKTEFVCEAMAAVGLKVMDGAAYRGLAHWVEQAITRDIAVAIRE